MTHTLAKRWAIGLLLVMPLIVSTACLSVTGSAPAATQPSGTTEPVATDAQPPEPTAGSLPETQAPDATPTLLADAPASDEISVAGEVVLGPGPFDLRDPAAGLADLASYRATLSLVFVGTEAGQPSQWTRTYVLVSTQEPLARQLTIESSGSLADLEAVFMAELDGTAYEAHGEAPCAATVIDPAYLLVDTMAPAGMLSAVTGADEAGSDTLQGLGVQHYTFDERALGLLDLAEATGELWMAADGGYLVKYVVTTQAGADYFGEGIEGTATWTYELTEVNQALAPVLPADCPPGMLDAPLLPDAADVQYEPGFVRYRTAASPAEALAFYQAELPGLGWQAAGEALGAEAAAQQDFTRAGQQLALIIALGEADTVVLMVVGPVPP